MKKLSQKSNRIIKKQSCEKLGQNENCPSKNSSRCLELSREIKIKVRLDQKLLVILVQAIFVKKCVIIFEGRANDGLVETVT